MASTAPQVRQRLVELERGYPGRIGLAAFAPRTGARVDYRATERFALASTFKVLTAAAVLRRARQQEPGLLDRLIRWEAGDVVENSPVTGQHTATGLTVAQLCEAALTHSDNTAGNLLLRQLGGPAAITAFARALGDPATRLDRWEPELNTNIPGDPRDTTTPAAMASTLRALTFGPALAGQDRDQLVAWLVANTTGGACIRAGLPAGWRVGDKSGAGVRGMINDVAVAWPPGAGPVVIAIYTTRTDDHAEGDNRIVADVARLVAATLGPNA
ncbi:class A beta-lactamase [Frankia sp. QA3]|uniref:class A beta-lactamase n=1 Tax=Frankia sp. QA3 TaxID=710111 RepID=UPI0003019669|nr:class A beta-lactamase [Frankia sp. QA3]